MQYDISDRNKLDFEKRHSQQLFLQVKPHCVRLSQMALMPNEIFRQDSPQLMSALIDINQALEDFKSTNLGGLCLLSGNIADYIFFPISHLLRQKGLGDGPKKYVLKILDFLVTFVWGAKADTALLNQLYPIVLNLSGSINMEDIDFKNTCTLCLLNICTLLPHNYFRDFDTNLPKLGGSISFLLDTLKSIETFGEEENLTISNILQCISALSDRASAEQLSQIFPGIVSQLINFISKNSLHYSSICSVFNVLRRIIIKVFDDSDLQPKLVLKEMEESDLRELVDIWQSLESAPSNNKYDFSNESANFSITLDPCKTGHRTSGWLRATSGQLKMSLLVMFKSLLLKSNNKIKLQTKSEIGDSIITFFREVLFACYSSLGKDIIPIGLDVFSVLAANMSDKYSGTSRSDIDDNVTFLTKALCGSIDNGEDVLQRVKIMYKIANYKLKHLIRNKSTTIFLSLEEEKISNYIFSLMMHFKVLMLLSQRYPTMDTTKELRSLKIDLVLILQRYLTEGFLFNLHSKKKQLNLVPKFNESAAPSDNAFDGIELPPHINAKQLAPLNRKGELSKANGLGYSENLVMLSNRWSMKAIERDENGQIYFFSTVCAKDVERNVVSLIQFLATVGDVASEDTLTVCENLLNSSSGHFDAVSEYLYKSVGLWLSSSYLSASQGTSKRDIPAREESGSNWSEYLVDEVKCIARNDTAFDSADSTNLFEESSYLLLGKSQDLIDDVIPLLEMPEEMTLQKSPSANAYQVYEFSYSISFECMSKVSQFVPLQDYQTYVLMDYLYPLLEALTFQSNSMIQLHAENSLRTITENYYHGSIETLIMENLDYLIDCMSIKLSATTLTPSLAAILLIVIKITGLKLLQENQLMDILTKIFVLIDSYHGYSTLVEGFFIVFEEIVGQIKQKYFSQNVIGSLESFTKKSLYHPWGIQSREGFLQMIDTSRKQIETFQSASNTNEKFQRKDNVPFSAQQSDSDDESDTDSHDDSIQREEEEEVWNSRVPKNIYLLVQKIFTYGFRLLAHPSGALKVQILKTLHKVYPILADNYSLILPLIADNWPLLVSLLMDYSTTINYEFESDYFIPEYIKLPALELMREVLEFDCEELFFSSRIQNLWEQLLNGCDMIGRFYAYKSKSRSQKRNHSIIKRDPFKHPTYSKQVMALYVKLILTCLNQYERHLSSTSVYYMVSFCCLVGIPPGQVLSREVESVFWVLKNEVR